MIKATQSKRFFSFGSLFRSLPGLLLIAIVLGLGFMVYQQVGLDSKTVSFVDVDTNEVKEFEIISVLPRDAIAAITNPKFVSAVDASRWMNPDEQVIGLAIKGEVKA